MKKKILSLLLAGVALCTLAACGSEQDSVGTVASTDMAELQNAIEADTKVAEIE